MSIDLIKANALFSCGKAKAGNKSEVLMVRMEVICCLLRVERSRV